jgi:endonuclease/exonuclease/phosphatase family metal-dependent hydrolase
MKKIAALFLLACWIVSFTANSQTKHLDLKIMSYNIKHGEGMDGKVDLSRSAAIIKAQAPALCAVQEVDESCTRSAKVPQTAFLADYTSMTGTFGKFMDFQGGEYGLASLSAKPLVGSKVLRLPDGSNEPRSSVILEVKIAENCVIAFANVHFDYVQDSPFRLEQAKTLVKYLDELHLATIITGDFNCTPDSPTMRFFKEQGFVFVQKGQDSLSFQDGNKVEIDHVIFRNSEKIKFNPKSITLLNEPIVSDHRPLVAVLGVSFE